MDSPDQFFAETDPVAAVVELDDLDSTIQEWAAAIHGDRAETSRDNRPSLPRPPRPLAR
jgi:hypothetical protein